MVFVHITTVTYRGIKKMVFIFGELCIDEGLSCKSEHTICGERKKVRQSHILFFGKLFKLGQHRFWQIVYRAPCTQNKRRKKQKKVIVMTSAMLKLSSPTIDLHGDRSTLLEVHDGVGVVVGLPDHDVSVQLLTSSWAVQEKSSCTKQCEWKGRKRTRRLPFSISLPGVGKIL